MKMPGPWRFSLLGYPAGFAEPGYLALGALAFLVAMGLVFLALQRRARVDRLLHPRHVGSLAPGISLWRPVTQGALSGLGLLLFAFALAQPQCGSKSELTKKRGIDLVVALDASKSMLARDVAPSRLERAKLELTTLLDELKGDRVGLVVFAGDAFIQCPLTADYSAAKMFLRAVDPTMMPQGGTNVGAALRLSQQLLEGAERGAKERVVVLLSDGEDLFGEVNEAVDALKEANIRVLTVGVGSEAGAPIPITDKQGEVVEYQRDEDGNTVLTRLDRQGLTSIAESTGGSFFYQPQGVAMAQVLDAIDRMQKSELDSRVAVRYDERFQYFAVPGLLLLMAAMLLGSSKRRVLARRAGTVGLLLALSTWGLSPRAEAAGVLERDHPLVQKGRAAYEAGRYDEALDDFTAAQRERPFDPTLEFNRADALAKLGRYDEAEQAFRKLAEGAPPAIQEKAHYNLGNVFAETGRRPDAIKEYRQALRLDPNDGEARHNLEVVLRNLPPPQPPQPDGGTDGGSHGGTDGGRPDAGPDGGRPDGGGSHGSDGGADGGMDGGSDGGAFGGPGGDGGMDGGQGSGEGQQGNEDGGWDGGSSETEHTDFGDGGVHPETISPEDAKRLLDSMKQNERNLQMWRFQDKKRSRKAHAKDW